MRPSTPIRSLQLFALIFTCTFLLHASVLRLPYFWDEAGYFIPAAHDLYTTGDLIAHSTLSNAHPPLVMIWLAAWWKLSNYAPAVTRFAMLLVASFGLLGVFRTAEYVAGRAVAIAATILTALYPVVFAQSSLAQLDIAAFALTIWGVYFHARHKHPQSVAVQALASIAKETTIVTPLTLCAYDLASHLVQRYRPELARRWQLKPISAWRPFMHLLALIPLCIWYAYHYHRTGHVFSGNPEYVRYNVTAAVTPLRVLIAAVMRSWHVFGYMNMFVLSAMAVVALRFRPRSEADADAPAIAPSIQIVFWLVIAAHVAEFSILGGALLARYMVPVIPLAVILMVSAIVRRIREWTWWIAIAAVAFVVALVVSPPWRIAPEDNLVYSDFVRLHKAGADYLAAHYKSDRVLTAWPASDELNHTYLGYVREPFTVVRVENFTPQQVMAAASQADNYDVVFAFSTKYDPPRSVFNRFQWWNRIQAKYFDYHRDLTPAEIATLLQGTIAFHQQRGGEWVAVIEINKARNARMKPSLVVSRWSLVVGQTVRANVMVSGGRADKSASAVEPPFVLPPRLK